MKPRIFLGSSGKQAKLLEAITRGLDDVADVEPWTTGTTRSDSDPALHARTVGIYLRADPSDLRCSTAGARTSGPS